MKYRLALDLGSTSIGWAVFALDENLAPKAIAKAGVRIFSDGRNPKDGSSLAVTRREARAMRRRRDRLLHRKRRMMQLLIKHGFFPADAAQRKALERINPYELRAKGLDRALAPAEFARALFHINQRRGFQSNRKTDQRESDASVMKTAIAQLRQSLNEGQARTVGELLWLRLEAGQRVRARYHQDRVLGEDGKAKTIKGYDLYIDRAMIADEFDALWTAQAQFDAERYSETRREALRDCLLHQRPLRPVQPGRCTLLPEEPRAPLALASQQRFRILQELNHLRIGESHWQERSLTLAERNTLADLLERKSKLSFTAMRKALQLPQRSHFNLEDDKRTELKGNATGAILGKKDALGEAWFSLDTIQQDAVVDRLLHEESETVLVNWLQSRFSIDEPRAQHIADLRLPEGYGRLSAAALARIVPALQAEVITYDAAVRVAGFEHHSAISPADTGEILDALPYYGEVLMRHVAFGSNNPQDSIEKRFGKIANPTVHIGLNQLRVIVNGLIKRYGHPSQIVVEVARELKQSREKRREIQQRQTDNQRRNERLRQLAAEILGVAPERVKHPDIERLILWEELSRDPAERRCPYSGVHISAAMALSPEVEIEHILPFSMTLDDSLNNKTLATRQANRIKGNRTPAQAQSDFASMGWTAEAMTSRIAPMPKAKRYRFGPDGYAQWLRDDKDFLARALNDTAYLSRIAREYLSLVCPQATWVVPGQLTGLLRAKLGLNDVLGLKGEKNRNDHRHHAVDACVIGITDRSLLQQVARAGARANEAEKARLLEDMPQPWPSYRSHVERAVGLINVSHKPDHSHEGAMMEDTAYGIDRQGRIKQKQSKDGRAARERSNLIMISEPDQPERHGIDAHGHPLPYKGYVGGNNHCIEITIGDNGKWQGHVVSRFEAYQIARQQGPKQLRRRDIGQNGQRLVMRLMINDVVRMTHNETLALYRMVKVAASGQIWFAPLHEANVDQRSRDKQDPFAYVSKMPGSLQKANAQFVTVSALGEVASHAKAGSQR